MALALPGCGSAPPPDPSSAAAPANGLRVVMLGTGTPNADPTRSGPAVAVVTGGQAYLVDAGPGIVRRAAAAAGDGIEALVPRRLSLLFLTHLHSDHTAGLPDVMLTPWTLERERPLRVFGPPGTRAMIDHLLAAYVEDRTNRLEGKEPADTTGWRVEVTEIDSGVVYRDAKVTVRAFRVPHGDWADGTSFGYRFDGSGRSVVISGDTRASDAVVQACAGCDLLVHEVYSAERYKRRDPAWQAYHAAAHTSTVELADLATRAGAHHLLLYHQLYWGTDDAGLLQEIRSAGYTGAMTSARDLGVY